MDMRVAEEDAPQPVVIGTGLAHLAALERGRGRRETERGKQPQPATPRHY
jgi:hypothetical protein